MRCFTIVNVLLLSSLLGLINTIAQSQVPGGSPAREIQTEVEKADPRVDQIIERANDHFRKAKLKLEDNNRQQAQTNCKTFIHRFEGKVHTGLLDHEIRLFLIRYS